MAPFSSFVIVSLYIEVGEQTIMTLSITYYMESYVIISGTSIIWTVHCSFVSTLRFAGGEGAQRRSGQRIFGTLPKGSTPKDRAFSGAQVLPPPPLVHQQRKHKRRVSGGSEWERRGTSTTTHRERRSWPDRSDKQKRDPTSGRRRRGVNQSNLESDARAR